MKVPNFLKATALSALIITSCESGPIHRVENFKPVTEIADSLSKASHNALDKTLKCFYVDTVEITKKDLKNPEKFMNKITNKAKNNIPCDTLTESNSGEITIMSNGQPGLSLGDELAMGMDGNIRLDMSDGENTTYIPKFLEETVQTVVGEGVFTNKDSTRFFVPIKGFARPK